MKSEDEALVRLSSKGQLVLPANIRRRLGLATGRLLRLRTQGDTKLTLSLLDEESVSLDEMLARARSWAKTSGRDLVEELHERRRAERRLEENRHGDRSH